MSVLLLNTLVLVIKTVERTGAGVSEHPVNLLVLVEVGAADIFAVKFVVVVPDTRLTARLRLFVFFFVKVLITHSISLPSSTAETSLSPR